ncbi:hypothetical protein RhiJN_18648 [Ceratobasidium sp. AG-Ba]|nr:hypothetical protein RhiJN_18648 [Ceratobasidium sp. AG-Ba]
MGAAEYCLQASSLSNILVYPLDESLVDVLDPYLMPMCLRPECATDVIHSAVTNFTSGCQKDYRLPDNFGEYFEKWYPIGRKVACLEYTVNGQYCVTQTLRAFQNWIGKPLSKNYLWNGTVASDIQNVPANVLCTDCTAAAYALIRTQIPSESQQEFYDKYVYDKCGPDFPVALFPADTVSETANSTAEEPGPGASASGASVTYVFGTAASTLFVIVTVLFVELWA